MLERTKRERFGKQAPRAFRPRQARKLLRELIDMIDVEVADPIVAEVLRQRIRIKMEQAAPGTLERSMTGFDMRRSMKFLAELDRRQPPFAASLDDFDPTDPAIPPSPKNITDQDSDSTTPTDVGSAAPSLAEQLMRNLVDEFRERLATRPPSNGKPPKIQPDADQPSAKRIDWTPTPPEPPKDPFLRGPTIIPDLSATRRSAPTSF
jgi:hypothetical protein